MFHAHTYATRLKIKHFQNFGLSMFCCDFREMALTKFSETEQVVNSSKVHSVASIEFEQFAKQPFLVLLKVQACAARESVARKVNLPPFIADQAQ